MSVRMMGGLVAAVVGLAMAAPAAAGGFYKCERPDGSVEYSQAPCEPGAAPQAYPDQLERNRKMRQRLEDRWCFRPSRFFSVGDDAAELREMCGDPRRVNRTETVAGAREQWVYRQGPGFLFVYVEGDRIVAIQD